MSNVQPPLGRMKLGRALFKSALSALSQDKKIIWAPVLGGLVTVAASVIIGIIAFFVVALTPADYSQFIGLAFAIVIGIFAAFVHVFTQATVMAAANQRFEGHVPSITTGLGQAGTRFGNLTKFALLEATVGAILRAVRENLQVIGNFVSFAGGLAWAVSSYFAMPIILFEGLGPIEAVKRSVAMIKEKWGSALRLNLFAGVTFLLLWFGVAGLMIASIAGLFVQPLDGGTFDPKLLYGALASLAGSFLLLLALAFVQQTVMSYACVALYRYAVGKPVPGFDAELMRGAFRLKKQKFTGLASA